MVINYVDLQNYIKIVAWITNLSDFKQGGVRTEGSDLVSSWIALSHENGLLEKS